MFILFLRNKLFIFIKVNIIHYFQILSPRFMLFGSLSAKRKRKHFHISSEIKKNSLQVYINIEFFIQFA